MKYLSLVILLGVLWGSWNWIYSSDRVNEDVHASIQQDVQNIIVDHIREKLPETGPIQFEKLWTETVNENKIRATFTYSFVDPTGKSDSPRIHIDGHATLNRDAESTQEEDVWSLDELKIKSNHYEFEEGLTIRASEPAPADSITEE